MPDNTPTGQPVPVTPTTPIVGSGAPAPAGRTRKTQAQIRQETLDRIAGSKHDIFRRVYHKTIQKGALTTFQYLRWQHDPYPLVLCSSIYHDGKVAGINLHYLTFKYIRYLIKMYCGKSFAYPLIKGNHYIKNAFRTYKRNSIRMAKILDCEFLVAILGSIRSFNPNEIERMRQEIQRQLRARMNPTADELTQEYQSTVVPNPNDPRYKNIKDYSPLERYGEPEWPRAMPPLLRPKPTLTDKRRNPDFLSPPDD